MKLIGKLISSVFHGTGEADQKTIVELRNEVARLKSQIKHLTHQLGVQQARTGDQKNIVMLLRKRLIAMGDVSDPVKAVRADQSKPKNLINGLTRHEALLARQAARKLEKTN